MECPVQISKSLITPIKVRCVRAPHIDQAFLSARQVKTHRVDNPVRMAESVAEKSSGHSKWLFAPLLRPNAASPFVRGRSGNPAYSLFGNCRATENWCGQSCDLQTGIRRSVPGRAARSCSSTPVWRVRQGSTFLAARYWWLAGAGSARVFWWARRETKKPRPKKRKKGWSASDCV